MKKGIRSDAIRAVGTMYGGKTARPGDRLEEASGPQDPNAPSMAEAYEKSSKDLRKVKNVILDIHSKVVQGIMRNPSSLDKDKLSSIVNYLSRAAHSIDVVVKEMSKVKGSSYPEGSPQTEAVLPTKNRSWGFWGTVNQMIGGQGDIRKIWQVASEELQNTIFQGLEGSEAAGEAREFLDSRLGRHFADALTFHAKQRGDDEDDKVFDIRDLSKAVKIELKKNGKNWAKWWRKEGTR